MSGGAFSGALDALTYAYPFVEACHDVAVLDHGEDNLNVVLKLKGGSRVVARFYQVGSKQEIAYELDLASILHRQGFPTPKPIATRDGNLFTEIDGRSAALFEFCSGRHIECNGPAALREIGKIAARLHDLTAGYPRAPVRAWKVTSNLVEALRVETDEKCQGWSGFRREILRYWDLNQTAIERLFAGPTGTIHHDLHKWNLLFEGEKVSAVLDFGEVRTAPFILELARVGHYTCCDSETKALNPDALVPCVEAYVTARPEMRGEFRCLKTAFDLVNLAEAVGFISENAAQGISHVDECNSYRAFQVNADINWKV